MADQYGFERTPLEALDFLKKGNRDYLAGEPPNKDHDDKKRRLEQRECGPKPPDPKRCGQKPFAVVVSCSDSRVPPERVFGYGLGDLFVVRTAGHVVDMPALGSIQYGVIKLHAPLIVVMGHKQCGAVVAAIAAVTKKEVFPGAIPYLIEPIKPAVRRVLDHRAPGHSWNDADTNEAVRGNSIQVAASLRGMSDAVLSAHLQCGRVAVVCAHYDLDTGEVDFFDEQIEPPCNGGPKPSPEAEVARAFRGKTRKT